MNDRGRMNVFETSQHLVEESLNMLSGQVLR